MTNITPLDSDGESDPIEGMSVIVTPKQASMWRAKWNYAGQRTFRSWHCNNLANMMREGKFRPKTQIAFVRVGGRYHLTNGQHTLAAIEMSGVAQCLSVVVSDGRDMNDVADDFARHDTHLTRQFSDSLVAHSVHTLFGVTPRMLHNMVSAITYYAYVIGETGMRAAPQLTHDEKMSLVLTHGRLAAQALGYFEGSMSKSYLTRKTTLASAMFCAKAQPDAAEEFFRSIGTDDGLRVGDPRKTILEWLRLRTTPGGKWNNSSASASKTASDHEMVKAIASAWNAWIDGRELRTIKINYDAATAEFRNVGSLVVRGSSITRKRENSRERHNGN